MQPRSSLHCKRAQSFPVSWPRYIADKCHSFSFTVLLLSSKKPKIHVRNGICQIITAIRLVSKVGGKGLMLVQISCCRLWLAVACLHFTAYVHLRAFLSMGKHSSRDSSSSSSSSTAFSDESIELRCPRDSTRTHCFLYRPSHHLRPRVCQLPHPYLAFFVIRWKNVCSKSTLNTDSIPHQRVVL